MRKKITIIFLLIITILFFTNTNILYYSVMESFNLFYNKIYLVLFPFLILGNILISYNIPFYFGKYFGHIFKILFNINAHSSFIIFLSMITGFPTGAVYINKFLNDKYIDEIEATKLLSISFLPSPMFVISLIGIFLLKNIYLGIIILISLYITNLTLGIIIRNKYKVSFNTFKIKTSNLNFGLILKDSIITSFNTLLLILGNITIFMILSNLLFNYLNFNEYLNALIAGIIEMTNGINKLSFLNLNDLLKVMLITFILSFSGLSIHSQVYSIINKDSIYKEVFINRIYASFLSLIISFLIYLACFII